MTGEKKCVRAFVAIFPSPQVVAKIEAAQNALRSLDEDRTVRWVRPAQVHLTVKFLGEVEVASLPELGLALAEICVAANSFPLDAIGLGAFPNLRQPRILWAGLEGELESLRALQAAMLRATQRWGEREERQFHPHLTLGRVKDVRATSLRKILSAMAERSRLPFGSWEVDELRLMQSELAAAGAGYRQLAIFRFGPNGHHQ